MQFIVRRSIVQISTSSVENSSHITTLRLLLKNKDQFRTFASANYKLHPFMKRRIELWEEEKSKQTKSQQSSESNITITLPDGKQKTGIQGKTTPFSIAAGIFAYGAILILEISRGLAEEAVAAKVNGELHGINEPIHKDSKLEILKFDTKEGQDVFWHSSSHILGQALEVKYGNIHLCDGPAIKDGFFYEFFMPDNKSVSEKDFTELQEIATEISKQKKTFEKMTVTREFALKMFDYNPFKKEIIESIPADKEISLFRSGDFIDLCRGPHINHTGQVKAFEILKSSSAYWMADNSKPLLQRVYGIAFPKQSQLQEHKTMLEEAQKRDHRIIGKQQELFMTDPKSPGSIFFLPHGARIYTALQNFMREQYLVRGYQEVITPIIFNKDLWTTSGHYDNYRDDMFNVTACSHKPGEEHEKQHEYMLKPMNCPGHCLIFAHKMRSYKELPVRLADFGVLHRNELSGALTGLTRVRKFQQDDAHIFCREDQIKTEINGCIDFMKFVYGKFGFDYELQLSTRPEKYMGDIELWNKAEQELTQVLNETRKPWILNRGDGAFYGPKIDVYILDALKRKHQCATIQLDFQLPVRFNLEYQTETSKEYKRPVIIHRAILGSIERMMAILIEHTAGKWPFWLSPRQCVILSVHQGANEYANEIYFKIKNAGYYVDADLSDLTIQKKIRESQQMQYNYIIVIGSEEMKAKNVNVRTRDGVVHGAYSIERLLDEFHNKFYGYQ